jgi:hypothetical protein
MKKKIILWTIIPLALAIVFVLLSTVLYYCYVDVGEPPRELIINGYLGNEVKYGSMSVPKVNLNEEPQKDKYEYDHAFNKEKEDIVFYVHSFYESSIMSLSHITELVAGKLYDVKDAMYIDFKFSKLPLYDSNGILGDISLIIDTENEKSFIELSYSEDGTIYQSKGMITGTDLDNAIINNKQLSIKNIENDSGGYLQRGMYKVHFRYSLKWQGSGEHSGYFPTYDYFYYVRINGDSTPDSLVLPDIADTDNLKHIFFQVKLLGGDQNTDIIDRKKVLFIDKDKFGFKIETGLQLITRKAFVYVGLGYSNKTAYNKYVESFKLQWEYKDLGTDNYVLKFAYDFFKENKQSNTETGLLLGSYTVTGDYRLVAVYKYKGEEEKQLEFNFEIKLPQ